MTTSIENKSAGRQEGVLVHSMISFVALAILCITTSAEARSSSVALLRVAGPVPSSFCTKNGKITVIHSCQGHSGYSNCSFGNGATLLTGPNTYHLGPGNATIIPGCYGHKVANTTAFGSVTAISTVWYDP